MRKIILMMSISLDGYMEDANGGLEWSLVDDELHGHFNEWIGSMGGFLEGRVTHQLMADFWPTADEDPKASRVVVEFAGIWRDMPKIVYSRTLERAEWNATVVHEVVPEEVNELKRRPGADLLLGGGVLGASFLRQGLVDELALYVHPVVLGGGTPFFRPSEHRVSLRLAESHTFSSGVVRLRYEVL